MQSHPAPTVCADQICGMLARLSAYVGGLALLTILAAYLWNRLPAPEADTVDAKGGWSEASRSYPAFAASLLDNNIKSNTYAILRHPRAGRKDILRWIGDDGRILTELEVYRPGEEFDPRDPTSAAALLVPTAPMEASKPESAGIIESKFGTVVLRRRSDGADPAPSCLGFSKLIENPRLQISGWTCQGSSAAARRVAIACMLDRLVLLASGNEVKLAELFARAELKRKGCAAATGPADWVTEAANPHLRGAL